MEKTKAIELFSKYGIKLSNENFKKLSVFENMLLEKNKVMNLTAITDDEEIWIKHFLDSAYAVKYIGEDKKICDVGCGAGFPSIPLAILKPDSDFILMDALKKRLGFIDEVKAKLELNNINSVHIRAEDAGKSKDHREKFDCVIARAVANLPVLCEYCIPLLKLNGRFIAMKSKTESAKGIEKKINLLGGKLLEESDYEIEGMGRRIILIEKIKDTPQKYPRAYSKIKSNPL